MQTISKLTKRTAQVVENRTRMVRAFDEQHSAEAELLDTVLAVSPALDAICSAIQLKRNGKFVAGHMSIWNGVELVSETTRSLYVDSNKRLLLVRYHADRDADVEVITSETAVREFRIDGVVEKLTAALDRQLQGKASKRTQQAIERINLLRSLTLMLRKSM